MPEDEPAAKRLRTDGPESLPAVCQSKSGGFDGIHYEYLFSVALRLHKLHLLLLAIFIQKANRENRWELIFIVFGHVHPKSNFRLCFPPLLHWARVVQKVMQ